MTFEMIKKKAKRREKLPPDAHINLLSHHVNIRPFPTPFPPSLLQGPTAVVTLPCCYPSQILQCWLMGGCNYGINEKLKCPYMWLFRDIKASYEIKTWRINCLFTTVSKLFLCSNLMYCTLHHSLTQQNVVWLITLSVSVQSSHGVLHCPSFAQVY